MLTLGALKGRLTARAYLSLWKDLQGRGITLSVKDQRALLIDLSRNPKRIFYESDLPEVTAIKKIHVELLIIQMKPFDLWKKILIGFGILSVFCIGWFHL